MLLLTASVSSLCGLSVFCSDEERYKEFYDAANAHWADYINSISGMECSVVITGIYPPEPERKTESTVVFDFPNFAIEKMADGNADEVSCFGKAYHFELKRNPGTGSYALVTLRQNESNTDPDAWKNLFFSKSNPDDTWTFAGGKSLMYSIGQALTLWGPTRLPQLIQYKGFSIESFTDDGQKIDVGYRFEPEKDFGEESETLLTPVRSGHFVLLKENYLLESAEFVMRLGDERLRYTLHCEYAPAGGKSMLKKKTMTARKENDETDPEHVTVFDYDYHNFKRQRDSRFTLSYYGLPEPDYAGKGFYFFRVLFMLLGCAVIAWAVSSFCRKLRK